MTTKSAEIARLYADENFPKPVVAFPRELGHDVLTAYEAGQANRRVPDDQVLEFAGSLGRAVLTIYRRDYFRLHRIVSNHQGIVACTADIDWKNQRLRSIRRSQPSRSFLQSLFV